MTEKKSLPFGKLRYLYVGSKNVEKDLEYYTRVLGAVKVWDISSMGTRVAAVQLGEGPLILLADHRPAGSCILIFQVDSIKTLLRTFGSTAGSLREWSSRFPKDHVTGSTTLAVTR